MHSDLSNGRAGRIFRRGIVLGAPPWHDVIRKNHTVNIEPGTAFYMFSDGIVDQVGGERRRAFGKKRIVRLLEENHARPMVDQCDEVLRAFTAYQGNESRRDDVTFLGFRMRV